MTPGKGSALKGTEALVPRLKLTLQLAEASLPKHNAHVHPVHLNQSNRHAFFLFVFFLILVSSMYMFTTSSPYSTRSICARIIGKHPGIMTLDCNHASPRLDVDERRRNASLAMPQPILAIGHIQEAGRTNSGESRYRGV